MRINILIVLILSLLTSCSNLKESEYMPSHEAQDKIVGIYQFDSIKSVSPLKGLGFFSEERIEIKRVSSAQIFLFLANRTKDESTGSYREVR